MKKILALLVMLVCFSAPAFASCDSGVFAAGQFCGSINGGFAQAVSPVPAILGTMALQSSNGVAITGGTITGLPSPSNASDAATKQYVDNTSAGLIVHTQASFATAAALPANTYNNGSSGVGATLTGNAVGALAVDGIFVSSSQRIVVKNEVAPANNGIYSVTATGSPSTQYVLTRTTDANTPGTGNVNEIGYGTYVFVTNGNVNGSSGWSVNSTVTTIGTSAINWVQFSASPNVTVSNSDGTLTISPNSGNIVASLSTTQPKANTWTAAQTFLLNGNPIILNTPSTSQQTCIPFQSAGTTKWTVCKNTDDSLNIVDSASGHTDFHIASNGGMQVMGAGSYFIAGTSFYADTAGHPYCDVRAFGAGGGVPSTDQTDIAAAFSACAGGYVFFPCGAYGNTLHWTVPASTTVNTAGRGCVSVTTTSTTDDVFVCATGTNGPTPITIKGLQIYGTGSTTSGTVPTGGYAINCSAGGNQQTISENEVDGTFNGIYIGGTNGRARDNRIENLYGTKTINEPAGGNVLAGNQLDNNSVFNATGGGGYGTYITYNTGGSAAITTGTIALSNGYLFIATVGGNTAPLGSGIPVSPMYKNLTDGSVTWQLIGHSQLILVTPGTESWIADNDMTSPANIAMLLSGSTTSVRNWISHNDVAGEIACGVCFQAGASSNQIIGNQFFFIGYNQGGVATGFPIWDLGPSVGQNENNVIASNTSDHILDAFILVQGDAWNITGNNSQRLSTITALFCAVELFTSGASTEGTTIVGNNINGSSGEGAVCMTGGGGSYTTVVGNTVYGSTISLTGTHIVNSGNN
jgi:hypothetical protein